MSAYNLEQLVTTYQKNNLNFLYLKTKQDACNYLAKNLNKEMSIGWGGSVSLNQCGILDYLRTEKFPLILDRDNSKLSNEKRIELERKMFSADVFLSSANAITEDGLIVNIDGSGNRVAPTIFGPNKVYFVVGRNKLVKNYQEAIARIKNYAAPRNAQRLGFATPCAADLICHNCNCAQRICNYTVVIKKDYRVGRTNVLFVDEDLGI